MKRFLAFQFILTLYFSTAVMCQEKMRIILIDLKPIGISMVESKAISRLLESDIVDSKLFIVLEREQVKEILKEQGLQQTGCTDRTCAVQIGKLLSANKILMGDISKLGSTILVTVKIVDVEKGVSQFSVYQKAKSIDVIDEAINNLVKKLVARFGGQDSGRFATNIETPRDFTVTDGNYKDKVLLKWKKVKGADKYYVFRSESQNGEYKMIHSTKETSFEDTKNREAESYYYKVRAGLYSKTGKFTLPTKGSRSKSPLYYYSRSLVPGFSQFYYSHDIKGGIFLASFVGSSIFLFNSVSGFNKSKSSYENLGAKTSQKEMDNKFTTYEQKAGFLSFAIGIFATVYLAHWVDVLFFNKPIYDHEPNPIVSTKENNTFFGFNVYRSSRDFNETRMKMSLNLRF